MNAATITFYALGAIILLFGLLVVTARNTVYSILFLVVDFLAVALLYAAMNSMFVAAIQVLVYAGGIVVLYLFVVMLVNLKRPPEEHQDPNRHSTLGGIMAAVQAKKNVAKGKPAYASSSQSGSATANTTDGSTSTRWSSGGIESPHKPGNRLQWRPSGRSADFLPMKRNRLRA